LSRGLALALCSVVVGFLLGVSAAYVERFFSVLLLDALLVGILGGSALLFLALLMHAPSGIVPLCCLLLGLLGAAGHRAGDYRYTLRSLGLSEADPGLSELSAAEIEGAFPKGVLQRARAEVEAEYQRRLEVETGHRGLVGHIMLRTRGGVVLAGVGSSRFRAPVPPVAVVLGWLLSFAASVLLCWLVLRRLDWAPRCEGCGRLVGLGEDGEPSPCSACYSSGEGGEASTAS
jgi:hypothetical protein